MFVSFVRIVPCASLLLITRQKIGKSKLILCIITKQHTTQLILRDASLQFRHTGEHETADSQMSVDKTSNEAEMNERFMRDYALVVYVRLLDGIYI